MLMLSSLNLMKALTRLYNQPTKKMPDGRIVGLLYRNPIDCLWKTLRTEGALAWYKGTLLKALIIHIAEGTNIGSTAHFLRIAPHTIITLTMNDIIIGLYRKVRS